MGEAPTTRYFSSLFLARRERNIYDVKAGIKLSPAVDLYNRVIGMNNEKRCAAIAAGGGKGEA